jgi:hypothetical protein
MYGIYNYDEDDYIQERDSFIQEAQQEVWDLWRERFLVHNKELDDKLKLRLIEIIEEWTGHPFALDIEVPPRSPNN